jgi:hypothetical protein
MTRGGRIVSSIFISALCILSRLVVELVIYPLSFPLGDAVAVCVVLETGGRIISSPLPSPANAGLSSRRYGAPDMPYSGWPTRLLQRPSSWENSGRGRSMQSRVAAGGACEFFCSLLPARRQRHTAYACRVHRAPRSSDSCVPDEEASAQQSQSGDETDEHDSSHRQRDGTACSHTGRNITRSDTTNATSAAD